jgi:hypothetical protein
LKHSFFFYSLVQKILSCLGTCLLIFLFLSPTGTEAQQARAVGNGSLYIRGPDSGNDGFLAGEKIDHKSDPADSNPYRLQPTSSIIATIDQYLWTKLCNFRKVHS